MIVGAFFGGERIYKTFKLHILFKIMKNYRGEFITLNCLGLGPAKLPGPNNHNLPEKETPMGILW
ncbi:hypothetical protein HN51_035405, partial [Arachis hypogaea]